LGISVPDTRTVSDFGEVRLVFGFSEILNDGVECFISP
jgi:hypothetical protein